MSFFLELTFKMYYMNRYLFFLQYLFSQRMSLKCETERSKTWNNFGNGIPCVLGIDEAGRGLWKIIVNN